MTESFKTTSLMTTTELEELAQAGREAQKQIAQIKAREGAAEREALAKKEHEIRLKTLHERAENLLKEGNLFAIVNGQEEQIFSAFSFKNGRVEMTVWGFDIEARVPYTITDLYNFMVSDEVLAEKFNTNL